MVSTQGKQLVREIASQHSSNIDLEISLSHEDFLCLESYVEQGIKICDGKIIFEDNDAKAKLIADYYFQVYQSKHNDSKCFFDTSNKFFDDNLFHPSLNILGHFFLVSSAHLDIFRSALNALAGGFEPFQLFRIMEKGLTFQFSFSASSFLEFFKKVTELTANDLVSGYYLRSYSDFVQKNEQTSLELYYLCRDDSDERANYLYNFIVLHFFQVHQNMKEHLIDQAKDNNNTQGNNLFLLGRLLLEERNFEGNEIDILIERTKNGTESQRRASFNGLAGLLGHSNKVDDFFASMLHLKDSDAILALANEVYGNLDFLKNHQSFETWLRALVDIPLGLRGAEQWRDHIYSESCNSHYDTVINSLELFFTISCELRPAVKIADFFPQTLQKLIALDLLDTQLLLWLNSNTSCHSRYISDIVSAVNHSKPFCYINVDELRVSTQEQLILLCNRLLGYVFEHKFLFSAFLSLLNQHKDNDVFLNVIFHYLKFLALNYPDVAREILSADVLEHPHAAKESKVKELLEKIDRYFDTLRNIPAVPEIIISSSEEKLFLKEKNESMRYHFKNAEKGSFLSVIPKIPLKAGGCFFSVSEGQVGAPNSFYSHSKSFPCPRYLIVDPLEYEKQLFLFRLEAEGDVPA